MESNHVEEDNESEFCVSENGGVIRRRSENVRLTESNNRISSDTSTYEIIDYQSPGDDTQTHDLWGSSGHLVNISETSINSNSSNNNTNNLDDNDESVLFQRKRYDLM